MKRILIIEDTPLLCDAYGTTIADLQDNEIKGPIELLMCYDYAQALATINREADMGKSIDLCLLDIRLGRGADLDSKSGLAIGKLLRSHFAECKIMVITSLTHKYAMHTIMDTLAPSGFFMKDEVGTESLKSDSAAILSGKTVFGKTATQFIAQQKSGIPTLKTDELKLLHLLAKGLKLDDIPKRINLSLSGIEYKKRRIAEKLGVGSAKINEVLQVAKDEFDLV